MSRAPELVIEGKAFVNGELRYTEIGIADGKIIGVGGLTRGGETRIDIGSSGVILPGMFDPHVHFRDPGMTQKEDFSTGTTSAVCGGVTCVLDMPNTKPPVTDLESLMAKKSTVKRKAFCDYGLFAAVTPDINAGLLAHLVPGFKLFMGSTTGNILLNDDEGIRNAMDGIRRTGKRMSVHAEDDRYISREPAECCTGHLRNRPVEAEYSALRRLAPYKGCKINICHNTDVRTLQMATDLGFTTEVTLHHLFFDANRNRDSEFKVNPPIRDFTTKEALWKAFIEGRITMFGSDHAPHTVSEKSQDFDSAPGGIPGVETTMPIVMDMVRKNTIPLKQAVDMGSANPAAAFGARKGRIEVGYDADLAIFDFRNVTTVDVRKLHSKAGHTPYHGREAVFPEMVLIRGQIQVKDREFCGDHIGEDICDRL